MNIEDLKLYLEENIFEGYYNSTFLKVLQDTFNKFKQSNDTYLKYYKTRYFHKSLKEYINVLWFIGNYSNNFFNFSCKESDNTFYDFASSHWAKIDDEDIKLNQYFYVYVENPRDTLEYQIQLSENNPLQEYIRLYSKGICNMNEIEEWVKSNMDWFEDRNKGVYKLFDDYNIIRERLIYLSSIYYKEEQFKKILIEYDNVKNDKHKLSKWIEYQKTFNVKTQCLAYTIFLLVDEYSDYIKFDDLKIRTEDFKYVLRFLSIKNNILKDKTYQESKEWISQNEIAKEINHKYFLGKRIIIKNGSNRNN